MRFLRSEYHKNAFADGAVELCPGPQGSLQFSPHPLADGFKGPTSKRSEKGREGEEQEGRGGKGKEGGEAAP